VSSHLVEKINQYKNKKVVLQFDSKYNEIIKKKSYRKLSYY